MPLNIQNKEFVNLNEESKPQPILHRPKRDFSVFKYFFLGLFIVIVVSSAVFLIYTFSFKEQGGRFPVILPTPEIAQEAPKTEVAPETTRTEVVQPAPAETARVEKPPVRPEVTPPPVHKFMEGAYTVYIASYPVEPPAAEEVSRWNEAGYEASVIEANNHYRVALGQYVGYEDAKIFAQQMWEAFENGYWIGKVQ
jgi:SPOR domain